MKYFELNDNKNKIYQNLRDTANIVNIVLREKRIVIHICITNKKG